MTTSRDAGVASRHGPWGDDAPGSRLVVIGLPGSVDERALAATIARLSASDGG